MATRKTGYPSDVSDEGMGVVRSVSDADAGRRAATSALTARTLQRAALVCTRRLSVADDAQLICHPWTAVQQQTQRWLRAGCFEALAEDLRLVLRVVAGRTDAPSAVILDSRTLQSTPESGGRAGFDGHKKRKRLQTPPRR